MLPIPQKIAFLVFAVLTGTLGAWGFYRLFLRLRRGRADTDARSNRPLQRAAYALWTTLTQARTFRKRPVLSFFHSFIFYGFSFYILVNLIDALEGYFPISISSANPVGATYNFLADILSFLVLVGVIALVVRRFALPSRRDFFFNPRTLLHPAVRRNYVTRDSVIVSAFILFHVGSRAVGSAAKLDGPDPWQPFATFLSRWIDPTYAANLRIFGYWGALGSVLLFLAYFPYSKHIHIFMSPLKYFFRRDVSSGELPAMNLESLAAEPSESEAADAQEIQIGAARLEDLAWPRLLDAYACIQCNRCQDVCPATATGKSLSPSALEINKRMELNSIAEERSAFAIFHPTPFEQGAAHPKPLLDFALSREAVWGCTTCGACLEVCPTQNEPMLDIIDIRRNLVMAQGEFPTQLQAAFRGMERAKNPWGISHDKRMDWTQNPPNGLRVPTTDEVPEPDVLYWVGCAASYDPTAQRTARAFVQLLHAAGVNFAVLGKKECCTGDSARRAGNELLYQQLAAENVQTLNQVRPKLVVATCPHCMNALGKEYKHLDPNYLGGDCKVLHHTEYLEQLLASGKLEPKKSDSTLTFHDPCYLGRHNGTYTAPRSIARAVSSSVVELPRNHENSFCCGAGGAQFWKEEEEGDQRISENRYKEVQHRLGSATNEKILAVGCPFCKSMLNSTPSAAASADPAQVNGTSPISVKDLAELLLESIQNSAAAKSGQSLITEIARATAPVAQPAAPLPIPQPIPVAASPPPPAPAQTPMSAPASEAVSTPTAEKQAAEAEGLPQPARKKWSPKAAPSAPAEVGAPTAESAPAETAPPPAEALPPRKKWNPKASS